jgi:hypothetical protein
MAFSVNFENKRIFRWENDDEWVSQSRKMTNFRNAFPTDDPLNELYNRGLEQGSHTQIHRRATFYS